MFAALMEQVGVITREGSIVDASFVGCAETTQQP